VAGLARGLAGLAVLWLTVVHCGAAERLAVLKAGDYAHYVERFNTMEDENVTNTIANGAAWPWLEKQIPFFACPDPEVQELYYFRWWSFRKHLVQTKNGWVITEFLTPVRHAGTNNTISCATSFHLAEGRWLNDQRITADYIRFWLRGDHGKPEPHFHKYSSWFADAVYERYLADGDRRFATGLLRDLVADYSVWQSERQLTNGLFWQFDVRDGMEESISGSRTNHNARPTINSYMYANARAIAAIARLAGKASVAVEFDQKAEGLRSLVEAKLWNDQDRFFEVLRDNGKFAPAREELGYLPWMFELPEAGKGYETAWAQLTDPRGFRAPYGLTTAERRNPAFRTHGFGNCEWDGAVWPFATSETLGALADVLRDYPSVPVTKCDYFDAFLTYTHAQHADGKPYVGEYQDEITGDWINGKGGRSRYYNHSTYADLVITGLAGLRPRADDVVEINPLLPAGVWNWFCLDGLPYHGHQLTILWDADGQHYGRGLGLTLLADGHLIAHANQLAPLTGKLP